MFGQSRVFYDKYHEVELAQQNLDLILQNIYANESDLIVVFVCGEYQESEWCGIELRAIRDLLKSRQQNAHTVMLLRLDDLPIDGLPSIDGFLNVKELSYSAISQKIMRRWTIYR